MSKVHARACFAITCVFSLYLNSFGAPKQALPELIIVVQPKDAGVAVGSGKYKSGSVVDIQAIPSQGFDFSRWEGEVTSPTSMQTKAYIGAEKQQIIAIFEPKKHKVEVKVVPNSGGNVDGEGYVRGDMVPQIVAHPAPGFAFDRWEGPVASKTEPETTLSGPLSGSVSLTAYFKPAEEMCVVSIAAQPLAGGKVSGTGKYARGSIVTLTAIPDEGYIFGGWTGPVKAVGQAETTLFVNANTALTAKFIVNRSLVRGKIFPEGSGRILGEFGAMAVGVPINIRAEAAAGYAFVRWDGPVADNTRVSTTITPAAGKTAIVTAVFEPIQ